MLDSLANLVQSVGGTKLTIAAGGLVLVSVIGYQLFKKEEAKTKTSFFIGLAVFVLLVITIVFLSTYDTEPDRKDGHSKAPTEVAPPPIQPSVPATEPTDKSGNSDKGASSPGSETQANAEWVTWRNANLGERPELPPEFDRNYPDCVADLRSRPINEVGPGDTQDCRLDLEGYRTRYLVPLYTRRANYGRAIRNERARLNGRVRSESDDLLLEQINNEDRDVNYDEGGAYQAYSRADQRVAADIRLCVANRCHPAR